MSDGCSVLLSLANLPIEVSVIQLLALTGLALTGVIQSVTLSSVIHCTLFILFLFTGWAGKQGASVQMCALAFCQVSC